MPVNPVGPCDWDISTDCCPDWDDLDPDLRAQATAYGTLVLWAATGRQFGTCEVTVRPCGRTCSNCPQGYYWDGEGTWVPYIFNGQWRNCWCGADFGCCTCDPHCRVYLPGPVASIQSVRVGGEVLPASGGGYFVLDQMWLIRVDTEECWPLCADQNLAPGDTDAFEVTYTRGLEVPTTLQWAAGIIACEWVKACQGAECRLPGRISSLSRQGVNVSMVNVEELLRAGLTGIPEVDQVIRSYNPGGLQGRTRFYSPDLQIPRQVTWP